MRQHHGRCQSELHEDIPCTCPPGWPRKIKKTPAPVPPIVFAHGQVIGITFKLHSAQEATIEIALNDAVVSMVYLVVPVLRMTNRAKR